MKFILFILLSLLSTGVFSHGAQDYRCIVKRICDDSSLRYPMFCIVETEVEYFEVREELLERHNKSDTVVYLDNKKVMGANNNSDARFKVFCESEGDFQASQQDEEIRKTLR